MKRTASFWTRIAMISVAMGGTPIAQNQDLETRIENLLLEMHGFEVGALEALAPRPALRKTLLRMVAKHRNADPDPNKSLDIVLLDGAVFALGKLKEAEALQPLSELLSDRTVDSGARSRAAQALGEIDADASREVLLQSLEPDNDAIVRMAAVEALGNSRDTAVIASLQRYLESEKDEHLKQLASKSISEIRSRIQ